MQAAATHGDDIVEEIRAAAAVLAACQLVCITVSAGYWSLAKSAAGCILVASTLGRTRSVAPAQRLSIPSWRGGDFYAHRA